MLQTAIGKGILTRLKKTSSGPLKHPANDSYLIKAQMAEVERQKSKNEIEKIVKEANENI